MPAQPAINVARLAPGFELAFSAPGFLLALAGSIAWMWLVRWRTGRHRDALWKSLVLPAGGVALCWMLLMTLMLPLLDYARSPRPFVARLAAHVPAGECIAAPGLPAAAVAALEHFGRWQVDARSDAESGRCGVLLRATRVLPLPPAPAGWRLVARVKRPTDPDETTLVYRRAGSP